jgi:hypothetical protein
MARAIHRFGPATLKDYPVDSTTVVTKGDMMFLDTDDVKPAASFTWDTNIATTQAAFNNVFVGIAAEGRASGDAATTIAIDVNPAGVWEYDQAADAVLTGGLIGPAKASGNALENQKVVECAAAAAIGRCHVGVGSSATRIQCTFGSARHTASANANAAFGS